MHSSLSMSGGWKDISTISKEISAISMANEFPTIDCERNESYHKIARLYGQGNVHRNAYRLTADITGRGTLKTVHKEGNFEIFPMCITSEM